MLIIPLNITKYNSSGRRKMGHVVPLSVTSYTTPAFLAKRITRSWIFRSSSLEGFDTNRIMLLFLEEMDGPS